MLESFRRLIEGWEPPGDALLAEVDIFAGQIRACASRAGAVFVPLWTIPCFDRGLGMLDLRQGAGLALLQANARLCEALAGTANVFPVDSRKWTEASGAEAFSPKLWHMAKVPFGNGVFKEAVRDIKAALRGLEGGARKIVLVDLDDTLWGGIVGDPKAWRLRPRPGGRAFADSSAP